MMESKIVATRRLQTEGRWIEASAFKDETIKQLRSGGMKKAAAGETAWKRMIEKFPPLNKTEGDLPSSQKGAADLQIEKLMQVASHQVPTNFTADVQWVYQHLDCHDLSTSNVPSSSALSTLKWARSNRTRFFENLLPKIAPHFESQVDQKATQLEMKSIEQIKQVLQKYRDKLKSDDLHSQITQVVSAWSEKCEHKVSQTNRQHLETAIADLCVDLLHEQHAA